MIKNLSWHIALNNSDGLGNIVSHILTPVYQLIGKHFLILNNKIHWKVSAYNANSKKCLGLADSSNGFCEEYTMGLANEFPSQNVAEALARRTIEGCTVQSRIENIDIVLSSLRLFDIRSIDYHVLKKTIPTDGYDYVIIDTAPCYDNLVMNALHAADYILTPVQLDYFNLTTSRFLRTHLYDELESQVDKWFLYYTFWQENMTHFTESIQSQYAAVFEQEFNNILDVQIPQTPATRKYTQTDEKVSVSSSMIGSQRLAKAFNKLACLIIGTSDIVEKF